MNEFDQELEPAKIPDEPNPDVVPVDEPVENVYKSEDMSDGRSKEEPEETWVHFNPRFHEVTKELLEKNGLHGLTRIPLGMKIKL